MRILTLYDGTVVTEAHLLQSAADAVDAGLPPVDAVLRVWRGPAAIGGRFGATQLIRGCTPWLAHLTATQPEIAAAMRARAAFLDHPETPCPQCGHPNRRHDGHPCLPTASTNRCLDCQLAHPAEPPDDDPACE